MRLALIRQSYTPYGGAERFVERALAALSTSGQDIDVSIIARHWQGVEQTTSRHHFLSCNPFYIGRLWRDAGFARAALRTAEQGCFDLVQSHERIPGVHVYRAGDGVHATWLSLRARTLSPAARVAQALSPWHRYTLHAEAAMFRHPALQAVICNSRMVRDDIALRFPECASRLHVIPNGVDLERFHPSLTDRHRTTLRAQLGTPAERSVILFVGSGFARKGVAPLLHALQRLQHDAELWVVGRDRQAREMQALANRLGLGSRVRFLGPQEDVTPYYGAADIFALPTLYDPFPNAALEALACGLPSLVSTTCGAAEVINRDNGAVTDPLDADAQARALDQLLADLHTTTGIARREAARQAVAHLSPETLSANLTALYANLCRTA